MSLVKVERFAPVLALPAIVVFIELANLSVVTASSAILAVVTFKSVIFAVVTALLARSLVPTSKSKILLVVIELLAMLEPLIDIGLLASPAAKPLTDSLFSSAKNNVCLLAVF